MSEIRRYLDGEILHIHIPCVLKKRGGRKLILSPTGDTAVFESKPQRSNALITLLVQAYKWQKLCDSGKCSSLDHLAEKLGMNKSYVTKVMRVNMLAPEIKEAILDGSQSRTLMVNDLLKPFPELWEQQRKLFNITSSQI